jgi:hypothetical protein
MSFSAYLSKYALGATYGVCGRKKPTARKNGRSFCRAHRSSTHSASAA